MSTTPRRSFPLLGLLALGVGAAFLGGPAVATAPTQSDVFTLMEEGKLAVDLVPNGAYELRVKYKNLSDKQLLVVMPPGVVADTFAKHPVLMQIGGQGGGGGGGGGGQGMGLMGSLSTPVQVDAVATVTIATCCLNYGIPEPTSRSMVFLKRVEEYTNDPRLVTLLTRLAQSGVETPIAQLALWHVTDRLPWSKLSRMASVSHWTVSPGHVSAAQQMIASTLGGMPGGDGDEDPNALNGASNPGQFGIAKPLANVVVPRFALALNPDPRGTSDSVTLVRQAARSLRQQHKPVVVSHRNYPPAVTEVDKPAVNFNVMVQTRGKGTAKAPVILTFQRSVWVPARKQWRAEPAVQQPVVMAKPAKIDADWLATQVWAHLAMQAIKVERAKGAAGKYTLVVANALPVDLTALTVSDLRDADLKAEIADVTVPALSQVELTLSAEQVDRLAKVKKLLARGFTVRER